MDSMDKRIMEAETPQECMEPSNVGRIVEQMKERDEPGHCYFSLRAAGAPHFIALIGARKMVTNIEKLPPEIADCVKAAEDIEPLQFLGLN